MLKNHESLAANKTMFGTKRCRRSVAFFITACLLQPKSTTALDGSIITDYIDLSSCSLSCENSGMCQFLDGTIQDLQNWMQSGRMIMKCQCAEGYTGTGCEQIKPICNLQTLKCPNGIPCDTYPNSNPTQYHCDCSVADRISSTTAQLCRNTYTEYCSSSITNGATVSFCTNGGKCKADLISAEIAPFNTSVNANYEHAGCFCPSEYDGPHCEFMRIPTDASPQVVTNNNTSTQAPTIVESLTSSHTMEPTTIESDETSLEDIIEAFNNQTKSSTKSNEASADNEERRQILRIVLASVFVSIGIICLVMAAKTYRHRRITKRRSILLQKSFIQTKNFNGTTFYQSPSITGSASSASEASLSSVSSMNRTIKTGTRTKCRDVPLPTANLPLMYNNKRKKKSKANRNLIPESSCSLAAIDDCDIVSVSNEQSFHRRCYPLTPFVVDDDDDEDDDENEGTEEESVTEITGGLWNDSGSKSSQQIQPFTTISMIPTTPFTSSQQSNNHGQSWIVSLSNRAINFTEIIRQPGYSSNHSMIEPVLDELHNTCNDIYLVDDDQENDYDVDGDNQSRYLDNL